MIAVGAVLAWAVNVSTSGVDVNTVGVILLIVGIIGAIGLDDLLVELGSTNPPQGGRIFTPRGLRTGARGLKYDTYSTIISTRDR